MSVAFYKLCSMSMGNCQTLLPGKKLLAGNNMKFSYLNVTIWVGSFLLKISPFVWSSEKLHMLSFGK